MLFLLIPDHLHFVDFTSEFVHLNTDSVLFTDLTLDFQTSLDSHFPLQAGSLNVQTHRLRVDLGNADPRSFWMHYGLPQNALEEEASLIMHEKTPQQKSAILLLYTI